MLTREHRSSGSELFRFVAAYERRFLPEHTTAVSLLDRLLNHTVVVVTEGESFRMREARTRGRGRPSKP